MKLTTYEIKIGNTWYKVKGSIQGLRKGWLCWEDKDGCTGLARPGNWREPVVDTKVVKQPS